MEGPLQNKHYRRLLAGRVVTNLGDSLYFVAAMWLVHELTGDPFYTGLAGFLTLVPGVFQFLAGPLVDEWSIRRTLFGTQTIQAFLVFAIPVAQFYDALSVGLVLVVMPALAVLNEFANPAMVTALPRLLDDEELVAANSMFSIASQGVDMIGNGVAGILIGLAGAVSLFAFDAVTFGLAAILFGLVTIPAAGSSEEDGTKESPASERTTSADGGAVDDDEDPGKKPYVERLRLGVDFIRGTVLVWLFIGAAIVNSTAGMALAAMPAYADALSVPAILAVIGSPGSYGILMAAFAAGNLLGALSANLVDDRPFGWTLIVCLGSGGLLWIAAIWISWLPATATLLVVAFVPIGIVNIQMQALIQSAPPEEIVGRVTSLLGSATVATLPIGSLIGGAIASAFGATVAMFGVGIGLIALTVYHFALPGVRGLPRVDEISLGTEGAG